MRSSSRVCRLLEQTIGKLLVQVFFAIKKLKAFSYYFRRFISLYFLCTNVPMLDYSILIKQYDGIVLYLLKHFEITVLTSFETWILLRQIFLCSNHNVNSILLDYDRRDMCF